MLYPKNKITDDNINTYSKPLNSGNLLSIKRDLKLIGWPNINKKISNINNSSTWENNTVKTEEYTKIDLGKFMLLIKVPPPVIAFIELVVAMVKNPHCTIPIIKYTGKFEI